MNLHLLNINITIFLKKIKQVLDITAPYNYATHSPPLFAGNIIHYPYI